MKKLFALLCAAVVLTGCGGSGDSGGAEPVKETKTCTMSAGVGVEASIKADATDDVIEKYTVSAKVDSQGVDFSTLTEEDKKAVTEMALKQMDFTEGEGTTVDVQYAADSITVALIVDLNVAPKETLDKMELVKGEKLSEMVKEAETGGATCK